MQEFAKNLSIRNKKDEGAKIQAFVSYDDPYVQPLIVSALKSLLPQELVNLITDVALKDGSFSASASLSSPGTKALQIMPYESLDFDYASSSPGSYMINSYMIRKALIRKHYLSTTVDHWVAKNPKSILKTHFKRSEVFEVDYAEFLDDALVEAFDLRVSLDRNAELDDANAREWWILKPGMSDRGQGIRLFSTTDELQAIFDGWEEDMPFTDGEDDAGSQRDNSQTKVNGHKDYITTSDLRHFVAQPYIHPPLLINGKGAKFHIRTYVLCAGSLRVHVYKHMLALFAAKPYKPPWDSTDDIETFLTNTCLQDSPNDNTVQRFWSLDLPESQKEDIFSQICGVTGQVFEGAARAMPIHFQPRPNAFEVFGLDFLVDEAGCAWLLEINSFPDFKQTGSDLNEIVRGFWEGVVRKAIAPFFGAEDGLLKQDGAEDMICVADVNLGRR